MPSFSVVPINNAVLVGYTSPLASAGYLNVRHWGYTMNKYQRIVLIAAGALIAFIQIIGISEYGLDESKGWAFSFLISAALLFVGLGSWDGLGAFLRKIRNEKILTTNQGRRPTSPAVESKQSIHQKPLIPKQYGIHISELDIAIEAHKEYAKTQKIYVPLSGNGKSINWNSCASVYASMRYAARKAEMKISSMVWNTILHALVVRMATEEVEGVGMGDPRFQELENEAYQSLEVIDKKVEESMQGKGAYAIEPLVSFLILEFGGHQNQNAIKALSAIVLINAETAHKKIIPEFLQDLS